MKKLILAALFLVSAFSQAQTTPDAYESRLQNIQREMDQMGIKIDVNNPNPFITGSALQNYFLNEKILLLERDAYFMMKSNKLSTTEEVADYQHRLKVLSSHANNILLGLVRALKNSKLEGFTNVEGPKLEIQWEELLEQCKKDPNCVSRTLATGEVIVQNDIIDAFAMSLELVKQIPYMHDIEFASVFQLVQLLHMETILGYAKISKVEFDLFIQKQKKLAKVIDDNKQMTAKEKEYHRTLITNTVNKWKKKILERKFDQKPKFIILSNKLKEENLKIINQLSVIRKNNPDILPESEICRRFLLLKKDRKRCLLRAKLETHIEALKDGQRSFIHSKEQKLPEEFWKNI